jgi:hypothetical protein
MQGNNHSTKEEQKANAKQTLLTQPISVKRNHFCSDTYKALVAANIPWNEIENQV